MNELKEIVCVVFKLFFLQKIHKRLEGIKTVVVGHIYGGWEWSHSTNIFKKKKSKKKEIDVRIK